MSHAKTGVTLAADELSRFVAALFQHTGTHADTAEWVATHLVTANLKGHDSHGVGMIPAYLRNISAGLLKQNAGTKTLRDNGAVIMLDGQYGFGQRVGREATEFAIARAKETGIVCLGLRNAHHLGRIGSYGEQCAAAGMVSTHYVNVVGHAPSVVPFGGREARMVTNPYCAVVPRKDGPPIVLDMATSAVALGKVRVAYHSGNPVPEGALVDHTGQPTTDPGVMFSDPQGSLGPFGGHKGYGLAVMCELLGGALAGEWTAQPEHARSHNIVNNMLVFVLDPAATGNAEGFQREVSAMVDYLRDCPPAAGQDRVRVPGEPERESEALRLSQGIAIDENSWSAICRAALNCGFAESELPAPLG